MSAVTVIARAKAKKGSEVLLEKAIRAVAAPTHAEAGCLKYCLQRSTENPEQFAIIEKWSSKEAHEKHLNSAHIQMLFKKLPELLAGPPEIQMFEPIPEGLSEKSTL